MSLSDKIGVDGVLSQGLIKASDVKEFITLVHKIETCPSQEIFLEKLDELAGNRLTNSEDEK